MLYENRGAILIVDEDQSILENISMLLKESGYQPVDSSSSREAITQLKENNFAAVIADIRMPEISGLELIDKIRNFNSHLPVILMTAFADLYESVDEIKLKAFDFILKPCEKKQILHTVAKAVHYHRLIILEKNYNTKLEDSVMEKTRELTSTLDLLKNNGREMMKRLAIITEFRDIDTRAHIKRIGLYSQKLSEALSMPEDFIKTIKFASALHDVGKVVIPDSVLLKPGELTEKEFEIIMKHTTIGAKMLSGSSYPGIQMAASIALTHHEKWDGKGYPKKLKSEKIPIEGRIVFLADRYDAIRSKRPYKPPVDHQDAVGILMEGHEISKPEHFDPAVLNAFSAVSPEFERIYDTHKS
jgi:putative two-component system response regulator